MVSASEPAGDLVVEAVDDALAGIGDEAHRARLARLEAHRRAGGNVEAAAARAVPVEAERGVGLEEMVMRADLDRPVAGIGDLDLDRCPAGIELDLAGLRDDFTGDHRLFSSSI